VRNRQDWGIFHLSNDIKLRLADDISALDFGYSPQISFTIDKMLFSHLKIPDLGNNLPRQGNRFSKFIGRLLITLFGWNFDAVIPDQKKLIIIVAPHTTNWDLIVAAAGMLCIGIKTSWLGKASLFRSPFGWIFRGLGGIPVERDQHSNLVEQSVAEFEKRDSLVLVLAPEGTRKKVEKWRTGFYYIGLGAKVPIVPATLDRHHKLFKMGTAFYPTGDFNEDMLKIKQYFETEAGIRLNGIL